MNKLANYMSPEDIPKP